MKCLFVQVRYFLEKGSRSEFYRRFRDNNIGELSRSEDGNIEYEMYYPLDSNDDICFLEKWDSEESDELHHQTLHYAILSELKAKYVKKVEIKKYWINECGKTDKAEL